MPWSTKKPAAADISPEWLQQYCRQFLQKLTDEGFTTGTMAADHSEARSSGVVDRAHQGNVSILAPGVIACRSLRRQLIAFST